MSIASGIQSLGGLVQRLRVDGRDAAHDVVRQMRAIEAQAGASSLDALARLCRGSARTIERVANDPATFRAQAAAIGDHVERLCAFAAKCTAAIDGGGDAGMLVPPPPLAVRDAREEKEFAATVTMFATHAGGALAELESTLRALPASREPAPAIAVIRRTMHTLKAELSALGMPAPQSLCHQAESTIDACTEAGRPLPAELLLRCAGLLQQHVARLRQDARAECADVEPLLAELRAAPTDGADAVRVEVGGEFAGSRTEFLGEARARATDVTAAMLALRDRADDQQQVAAARRALHTIKGIAAFVNLAPVADVAQAAAALLDAASGCRAVTAAEIALVLAAADMIRRLISSVDGARGPERREWVDLIARLRPAAVRDATSRPIAAKPAPVAHDVQRTVAAHDAGSAPGPVTLAPTLQKLALVAADAAARTNKQIAFAATGAAIELDRDVAARIDEALVHLVRNAVDHGVEAPAERVAAGKRVAGNVALHVEQQPGTLVIEVRDDGRGLDRTRIVEQAIAKGVAAAGTSATTLSDAQLFALILAPGFSTAARTTELSGRGIGLDVVRANVDALQGRLELDSRAGTGTTFRVHVPVAHAAIDCIVVAAGSHRYVVPIACIERVLAASPGDVHRLPGGAECICVRGGVLPLHRAKRAFARLDTPDDVAAGIVLVVAANGRRSCVLVDDVAGRQRVVAQPLAGTSGVAILRDGGVALLLDVGTLQAAAVEGGA